MPSLSYFAEICAKDIHNVDACVLRITHRLAKDVSNKRKLKSLDPATLVSNIPEEQLSSLYLCEESGYGDSVRIIGYNQGGEGRQTRSPHVYLSVGFERGEVRGLFQAPDEAYEDELFHPIEDRRDHRDLLYRIWAFWLTVR